MDLNQYLPPLPPPQFATAGGVACAALPAIRPSRRVDVPDWAEENRRIEAINYRGKWKNDFAPYMIEPSRMMTSRKYGAVVFVGPARTAKTESLILNTIGHRIECMPRNMLVVAMTQDTAKEFSIEKVDPFLRANKSVASRMLKTRNADAIFAKRFVGNMRLRIGWPVISQLSMSDIPDVLLTDYDRMPIDVGGEGSAFDLARKRNQQYGTLGKTCVESSPGFAITDDDWRPSSPHEAPNCEGILSLFNRGTRGKRYWKCPECHEMFQPLFKNLVFAKTGSAGERAKTVEMACPHCGNCIAPDKKLELERSGIWLHETSTGGLAEIDSDDIRDTDIVSFWCEGPVAAMQDWQQIVFRHLQATEEFKSTGKDQALKTTKNVDQGRPHKPAILTVGEALSRDGLRALSEPYPLKIAPTETRFITLHVDIQKNMFVVGCDAWGVDLERWLIDRFDIVNPPADAPGADGRAIDPARYVEDWSGLFDLLEKGYSVEGSNHLILPRAMIIDSGGAKGVTRNAYKFRMKAKRKGLGHRVYIQKGVGGEDKPRASIRTPEKQLGERGKKALVDKVIFSGTDPLKDEIVLSLTRKEAGPGKYHLPEDLDDAIFDEFCAEHRLEKGWEPKKSGLRNEALDHAVYGKALAIVMGAEKINWNNPPEWAREISNNSYAILDDAQSGQVNVPVAPKTKRRRIRSKGI